MVFMISFCVYSGITKKLKEHEYKLQRHTKSKEDYLRYIQYQMDLMKLVKQRREVIILNSQVFRNSYNN